MYFTSSEVCKISETTLVVRLLRHVPGYTKVLGTWIQQRFEASSGACSARPLGQMLGFYYHTYVAKPRPQSSGNLSQKYQSRIAIMNGPPFRFSRFV